MQLWEANTPHRDADCSPTTMGRRYARFISFFEPMAILVAESDRRDKLDELDPEGRAAAIQKEKDSCTPAKWQDLCAT